MTEKQLIRIYKSDMEIIEEKYGENQESTKFDKLTIEFLEEHMQYREIGTVDECRDAMERYRKRKPIILSEQSTESEGKLYVAKYFKCPTCGNTSTYFGGLPNNCHNCGQSLESDIS